MKIKLPLLQVSGVILAFAMAIIAKFIFDVPKLLEDGVYILALILVIVGNFRTNSKRKQSRINSEANVNEQP